MKYKYSAQRRLFLSNMAMGLGLTSVASLFNFEVIAQNNQNIENVIFFFFNHTANIPKDTNDNGTFHLENGSGMPKLVAHKDDALFIRNCDHIFDTGGTGHGANQYSVFTGFGGNGRGGVAGNTYNDPNAGKSADVVAGQFLQQKFNTVVPHLNLAFDLRHGDSKTAGHPYLWETSSFSENGRPTKPNKNLDQVYNRMMDDLNCNASKASATSASTTARSADECTVAGNSLNEANSKFSQDCAGFRKADCDNLGNQFICSSKNNPTLADLNTNPAQANPSPQQGEINYQSMKFDAEKLKFLRQNMKSFKSKYLIQPSEFEVLEAQLEEKIDSAESGVPSTPITEDCSDFKKPVVSGGGFQGFRSKSNGFYDIMVHALKNNYAKSITYYSNIWNNSHHGGGGHGHFNNAVTRSYQDELSTSMADLVQKLKNAGIFNKTMIVIAGEFADQNDRNSGRANHRSDKIPWLIFNSGKSGQYKPANHGGGIHPGDIHLSVLQRLGMNLTAFGGGNHKATNSKRRGNKLIF